MKSMLSPVIILAGGLATRLRPVTQTVPKTLLPICNQPFINHQLRLLAKQGLTDVIICVGFLGEMIERHVGDGHDFGLNVKYSYDGPTLLGTGGAIKKALTYVDNSFFVLYGDSYLHCDYAEIERVFHEQNKLGLMTILKNAGRWDTSNVEYKTNKIIQYDKKNLTKDMQYIDYGLGLFTKAAFAYVPDQVNYDLAHLYQMLIKMDSLAAFEVKQRFYEIGSFSGIKELELYLATSNLVISN